MELDYMEKENTRLAYFSNIYLIIPTLLIQLPYVFNWISIEDFDRFISINTLYFIFTGFVVSLISSSSIKSKLIDEQDLIVNKIYLLKVNEKARKAFEYIIKDLNTKYFEKDLKNIKHYIKKSYYKTTRRYTFDLLTNKIKYGLNFKVVVGIALQSFFISTLQAVYKQLDVSWFEYMITLFTMVLGGLYGYKTGISVSVSHDVYPIKIINLELDKYMVENNIEFREVNWEDRTKAEFYDFENDLIIS